MILLGTFIAKNVLGLIHRCDYQILTAVWLRWFVGSENSSYGAFACLSARQHHSFLVGRGGLHAVIDLSRFSDTRVYNPLHIWPFLLTWFTVVKKYWISDYNNNYSNRPFTFTQTFNALPTRTTSTDMLLRVHGSLVDKFRQPLFLVMI